MPNAGASGETQTSAKGCESKARLLKKKKKDLQQSEQQRQEVPKKGRADIPMARSPLPTRFRISELS